MKIAWNKEKLAIAIQCKNEQEFNTMMQLFEENTKTNFSIQSEE